MTGGPDIVDAVRRRLADSGVAPTAGGVAAALRVEGGPRGDTDHLEQSRRLRAELTGLGPLESLLGDPAVTDILVNAPDEVWIDRGRGLERVPMMFDGDDAVRRLAVRLAATAGRRLDTAAPFVDARLPDGNRLHAVLRPVSTRGTCLSVRVLRQRTFTLDALSAAGTLPPGAADLLLGLVRARIALAVSGATGSGKSTLLGVLLSAVDPAERIVCVEDVAELVVDHPHVVRLESRAANVEGAGAVTMRDLVRQALRMRPDRLVVGEVRGAEIIDLLTALNTGHEGGMVTVHANAAIDVPARFEALGGLAGLGREALHSQLGPALRVVVHLRRHDDGLRRVTEIAITRSDQHGRVICVPAVTFRRGAPSSDPASSGPIQTGPGAADLTRLFADRGVRPPALLTGASTRPSDGWTAPW